jgi:hypothetical protein
VKIMRGSGEKGRGERWRKREDGETLIHGEIRMEYYRKLGINKDSGRSEGLR